MNNVKRGFAALFALVLILAAGCGKKTNNKVVDYKVDIPTGFEELDPATFQELGLDDLSNYWYNADGSNVNVNITEKDKAFKDITADALRDAMLEVFEATYGAAPTITDKYFTSNEVCGMPAHQYCYRIELMGVEMTQLVVSIDADKTYTITYTDTTGDWMKDFETSATNIELVFE